MASTLNNMGNVSWERGELDRAAQYYQRGLEVRQRLGSGNLLVAGSLNNLGLVAWRRGELTRAAQYYQRALEIKEKVAPASRSEAKSLSNLGNLALEQGELERAEYFHRRALDLWDRLAPQSLYSAGNLMGLGNVARHRGELAQAMDYHQRALEIKERLAPGSRWVAASLTNLGNVAEDRGDTQQSADYHRRALKIWQKLTVGSLHVAESLNQLGKVARDQEEVELATTYFDRSIEALENQVGKLGGSQDVKGGYQARFRHLYRDSLELRLAINQPEDAFAILERSRARSFLALLAQRDLTFPIPEKLMRARRSLAVRYDRTLHQLAKLNPATATEKMAELRQELARLQRQRADMVERVRRDLPQFAALQYPQPLTFREVQEILDPGTVMLSYSVGKEQTDLFVIMPSGDLETETLAVGERALKRQVELFRDRIRESVSGSFRNGYRGPGHGLYETLIAPVAPRLEHADRILIIPDGPLHRLPFAALIRDADEGDERPAKDWQYLVEWKPIHSALSATVYAQLKKARRPPDESLQQASSTTLVAFGDPLYPGEEKPRADFYVRAAAERGFDFSPLPYTRQEVDRIAGLFARSEVYLGAEATEEQAKAVGRETRILHFATHGRLDDAFPLNSFLALSIPKTFTGGRDNGLLQVWEIFERLRLDADLVVLSACDSGLGKEQGGDGLIGLTRAFQYAGARSVAASLWSVDDLTTAELVVRFYRHLRVGKPQGEALRAAQVELMRGPITVERNGKLIAKDASAPYYWAAFQIYGDWR